jgi:hypothetical protein
MSITAAVNGSKPLVYPPLAKNFGNPCCKGKNRTKKSIKTEFKKREAK